MRHIGVPVGHGLHAHLDDPDDWNQRPEIPEPPHEGVRETLPEEHAQEGEGAEQRRCAHHLPGCNFRWVGVKDGEVLGEKGLEEIGHAGYERIAQAGSQGDRVQGAHGASPLLHRVGHDGRNGREREEGDLLRHQAPGDAGSLPLRLGIGSSLDGSCGLFLSLLRLLRRKDGLLLPNGSGRDRNGSIETAQGPVVQQQKQKRKGHEHGLGEKAQGKEDEDRKSLEQTRAAGIPDIEPQGPEHEKGAEDILSFGHPGHRFHVQGMKGEEKCNGGALPDRRRHPVQDEKEQERIGRVKEKTHPVMAPRVHSEEGHVQQVGNPRDRVPVAGMGRDEGPGETSRREPPSDMRVLRDVLFIIEIDELVAAHLPKHGKRHQHEKQRDRQGPLSGGHSFWACLTGSNRKARIPFPCAGHRYGAMTSPKPARELAMVSSATQ